MIISLIVALSENRVIGSKQKLPWHLTEDLKRFKALTIGHPVIMGRKTFESIGRLLPQRQNIIITRDLSLRIEGATVVHSLEDALALFADSDEQVFIIGGGEIFKQATELCDRVYLTQIHQAITGDVYFPILNDLCFTETFRQRFEGALPYSFINLIRKK
jgi:dihydrofolate reductase